MSKEKTLQDKGAEGSYRLENFRRRTRYTTVFIILAIAFFVIIVVNINSGNVHIPLSRIVDILLTKNGDPKEVDIIWRIRLPRRWKSSAGRYGQKMRRTRSLENS